MNCFNCKKDIGNTRASKWPVCTDQICTRLRDKLKAKNTKRSYRDKSNDPIMQKKLAVMKREMPDKQSFAKKLAIIKKTRLLARKYRVSDVDVLNYRRELFGEMDIEEVRKLGRDLLNPVKPFERKEIKVQVYKILDMVKFERGGTGTYEGLEFDRTEIAQNLYMPFNTYMAGVEAER